MAQFIGMCDKEDWYSALAIYQHIAELKLIIEEDEGQEFIQSTKDWLAKAENPSELYVCY